jgi:hypothetical protein
MQRFHLFAVRECKTTSDYVSGVSHQGKGKQDATSFWLLCSPRETMGTPVYLFICINVQKAKDIEEFCPWNMDTGVLMVDKNETEARALYWILWSHLRHYYSEFVLLCILN